MDKDQVLEVLALNREPEVRIKQRIISLMVRELRLGLDGSAPLERLEYVYKLLLVENRRAALGDSHE